MRKPLAGARTSQSMMRPPTVRGCFESITIHGRGSSGRGFQPGPSKAAAAPNSGNALDALTLGASVGSQSSISIRNPYRALAALARDDGKLDEPELRTRRRSTVPRRNRSPGSHLHVLPARRGMQVALHIPPNVLARGIDQFQLQIIDGAAAAQPKMHRVLLRHLAAQRVPRDDEAPTVLEIEIHSQRRDAPRGRLLSLSSALPEVVACHSARREKSAGFFRFIVSSGRIQSEKQLECILLLEIRDRTSVMAVDETFDTGTIPARRRTRARTTDG